MPDKKMRPRTTRGPELKINDGASLTPNTAAGQNTPAWINPTEEYLRERWPAIFNDQRLPLKIFIAADIGVRPGEKCAALGEWTSHWIYLRNLVAGGDRYGLDGMPAGTVSPGARLDAWQTMQRRRASLNELKTRSPGREPARWLALTDNDKDELTKPMPAMPEDAS
jgi:sRNA-binding protein